MNTTLLNFSSRMNILDVAVPDFTTAIMKNEPMLFSCDRHQSAKMGGPLTNAFLDRMPVGWDECVIDSRVHMLMEGWFPCIPGWHLDDVPRTRIDGQPDHVNPEYHAEHLMCIVGDCSKTMFINGDVMLEDVPAGDGTIYEIWHSEIEAMIERGELSATACSTNNLIQFDWQTFHRGSAATHGGWRWFIRATRNTKRIVTNELRRQVQVYLPAVNAGW